MAATAPPSEASDRNPTDAPAGPSASPNASPNASASASAATVFATGSSCEVHGLLNAPELNGKIGVVTGYDKLKERYVVTIDGVPKALKGVNLRPAVVRESRNWAAWADKARSAGGAAKRVAYDVVFNAGYHWGNLQRYSPLPQLVVVFAIVGTVLYVMQSDPRYAGNSPRTAATPSVSRSAERAEYDGYAQTAERRRLDADSPKDPYGARRSDERNYDEPRRRSEHDFDQRGYDDRNYDERRYNNARSYDDYDDDYSHRGGGRYDDRYGVGGQRGGYNDYGGSYSSNSRRASSSGSSNMMLILLVGGFLAYKFGLFERLRGMNFFQLYFLMNILTSLFGGPRMGGMMGGGMMGRRRRFF